MPGCNVSSSCKFFYLPKNKVLREIWINILNINLNLKHIRICERHFDPKDVGLKRLRQGTVPVRIVGTGSTAVIKSRGQNINEGEVDKEAEICTDCEETLKVGEVKKTYPVRKKLTLNKNRISKMDCCTNCQRSARREKIYLKMLNFQYCKNRKNKEKIEVLEEKLKRLEKDLENTRNNTLNLDEAGDAAVEFSKMICGVWRNYSEKQKDICLALRYVSSKA